MRLAEKTDVIKASPAIHIQSKITHLQRRGWNVLLANAYDELPIKDIHSVNLTELAEKLDFNSKNDDYLKETLEALVNCTVKWNLLDKDGKQEWGIASLLASAAIKDGVCTYSFAAHLRPKLHNPRIYAKINLKLQNKFNSKYALILWELCVDYFDESRNEGETPFVPLKTFRELMGLGKEEYQEFKRLNRDVIKPAIKEINEISDFHVEVEQQKKGRRVAALKFKIRKVKRVAKEPEQQRGLFADIEDLPPVVIDMIQAGMHRPEALRIWNQGFNFVESADQPDTDDWSAYIQEKIKLLRLQPEVKNRGGWLRLAIANNWTSDHFKKQKQIHLAEQRKIKRLQLERQRDELQREKSKAVNTVCQQIIDELPQIVDELINELLNSKPVYRQHYDSTKTPLENYNARAMFSSHVDSQLMKHHPDKFEPILAEYQQKITEVEQQIEQLQPKRVARG